jgi:type I restriction-modification system DNA methylase subunit
MNPNVRSMLEEIYQAFRKKFQNPENSWDNFIDFLAGDNCASLIFQFDHQFEWLYKDKDLVKVILEHYDPSLLDSDYHDHLGEMYIEYFPEKSKDHIANRILTNKNIEKLFKDAVKERPNQPYSILDPYAGTGRLLMCIHKTLPDCHLFGVESDIRVMRIAMTNMVIHKIPVYMLHADISKHATNIADDDGYYNWQFANNWYSCMDDLKPRANH